MHPVIPDLKDKRLCSENRVRARYQPKPGMQHFPSVAALKSLCLGPEGVIIPEHILTKAPLPRDACLAFPVDGGFAPARIVPGRGLQYEIQNG